MVRLSGGTAEPVATGQPGPWAIALTSTNIYWTNRAFSSSGAIMRVAK